MGWRRRRGSCCRAWSREGRCPPCTAERHLALVWHLKITACQSGGSAGCDVLGHDPSQKNKTSFRETRSPLVSQMPLAFVTPDSWVIRLSLASEGAESQTCIPASIHPQRQSDPLTQGQGSVLLSSLTLAGKRQQTHQFNGEQLHLERNT